MNDTDDTTAVAEAPTAAQTAPAPKPAAKPKVEAKAKTSAKKPAKVTPAKKAVANGVHKTTGTKVAKAARAGRGMADVPAAERRLALVRALRKAGAVSPGSARAIPDLAAKLGYTNYDVYCLAYHKYHLATAGIVKVCEVEGRRGLSVYLTAKGQKATDEQVAG